MKEKKRICIYAKKATVSMLAFVLILTATLLPIGTGPPGIYAYAEDTAQIELKPVSVDQLNDTLVLAADLTAVPSEGLSAVEFKVEYPQEFTLEKAEDRHLMGENDKSIGFHGEDGANPYYIAFGSMDEGTGGITTKTGELAYFTFKVKAGSSVKADTAYKFELINIKAYKLTTGDSVQTVYITVSGDKATYTHTPIKSDAAVGSDGKITVEKQSSGTAKIKTETIEAAVKNEGTEITLDMSSNSGTIATDSTDSVVISKEGATAVSKAQKKLIIDTDAGKLEFDSKAAGALGTNAEETAITISLEKKTGKDSAGNDVNGVLNISINAMSNETNIKSFGDGTVKVDIKIPSEMNTTNLKCMFYDLDKKQYKFVNGEVSDNVYSFNTNHFSEYMLSDEEKLKTYVNNNSLKEGVEVSGTITSWNNLNDYVIKFYDASVGNLTDDQIRKNMRSTNYENSLSMEATTTGPTASDKQYATSFKVEGVGSGSYKIAIYKPGKYVVKVVPFTVESSAVELGELKMWLYGDVNYDGKVNSTGDVLNINRYIANLSSIFDQGDEQTKKDRFDAANVTGIVDTDTVINSTGDVLNINRYIANLSSALDRAE